MEDEYKKELEFLEKDCARIKRNACCKYLRMPTRRMMAGWGNCEMSFYCTAMRMRVYDPETVCDPLCKKRCY